MANEKRLIDANALKAKFPVIEKIAEDLWYGAAIRVAIDRAPTIDAVEVVHGQWEKSPYFYGYVRCSICHDCNVDDMWIDGKKWKYCPNCGAKMKGENNNG
jgi:hypothetical protein